MNTIDLSFDSIAEVDQPTLAQILAARHALVVEWIEPIAACGFQGNQIPAYLTIKATVNDVINIQRYARIKVGTGKKNLGGSNALREDANLLIEFAKSRNASIRPA